MTNFKTLSWSYTVENEAEISQEHSAGTPYKGANKKVQLSNFHLLVSQRGSHLNFHFPSACGL